MNIGILHPGEMGVSVAASARNSSNTIYWVSVGRSPATLARAQENSFVDAGTLAELCRVCDVILAVCPPHAAEDLAREVIACGYHGLYCDANAIAPQRAKRIGELLGSAGIGMVDGGIIGGPAWEPGATWLYLSGERAQEVANCFSAGPLETVVIGDEIGKASALKMCYAAYTKGTTALLTAVLGAAEQLDVRSELYKQWERDNAGAAASAEKRVIGSATKAWRFEGEMREIAATFEQAGMPEGFHQAAAEIYARLASFKDAPATLTFDAVLEKLKHESA